MNGFLDVNYGSRAIPLSSILNIGDASRAIDARGQRCRPVRLTEDRSIEMSDADYGRLMIRPIQIMPAEPGLLLLTYFFEDSADEIELYTDPLIGWALCMDGEVRPFTTEGVNGGRGLYPKNWQYVQHANGEITASGDCDNRSHFANREEFKAWFPAERARDRADAAARAASRVKGNAA